MMLTVGSLVNFNISEGMDVGTAKITDVDTEIEDGQAVRCFRLEVVSGSLASLHRDDNDELWVNESEIKE